jgi:hypothetical protein
MKRFKIKSFSNSSLHNITTKTYQKKIQYMWHRRRKYIDIIYKHCKYENTDRSSAKGTAVAAATCSRWFLASGLFYPEDGGDTFLRNVGSHKIYTAPNPRRRHSS